MKRVDKTDISHAIVGVGVQNALCDFLRTTQRTISGMRVGIERRREKQTRPSATSMPRLRRRNVRSSTHSPHGAKQCS
eukprot:6418574-Ditylum_brightwellii.AAC.1